MGVFGGGLLDGPKKSKRARKCYFDGGYAYHMRGTAWRKVSDAAWDTKVLSREAIRVLGTRFIDGHRVTVFSIKGRKGRFAVLPQYVCR